MLVLILFYVVFFNTDRFFLLRLFLVYVRPVLEHNFSVWSSHASNDISILESIQKYSTKHFTMHFTKYFTKHFTKRLIGMESLTYNKRLIALKLPSLSCRRNRSDVILAIIQNYAQFD